MNQKCKTTESEDLFFNNATEYNGILEKGVCKIVAATVEINDQQCPHPRGQEPVPKSVHTFKFRVDIMGTFAK